MVVFEYKGKKFYMDGRLKKQIDEKVIPDLKKRDKDVVFCVDGKERSGKSKFSDILAAYVASQLGTDYNLGCICMDPFEFRDRIKAAKKNEVVIYDEAHRGMSSRRSMSEVNAILVDLMMEMGQKNLCVFVVLPTFFMLDRYVALFRIRGLFHIYERKGKRGFWVYFNEKSKLYLYDQGKKYFNYNCLHWPMFRGRFYEQYSVDEEEYRQKKKNSFEVKPAPALNKRLEVLMDQRDKAIYALSRELKMGERKLSKFLIERGIKLEHAAIGNILSKFNAPQQETTPIAQPLIPLYTFQNKEKQTQSV